MYLLLFIYFIIVYLFLLLFIYYCLFNEAPNISADTVSSEMVIMNNALGGTCNSTAVV